MVSKIEDIVIHKIEITAAAPSPMIKVHYEFVDDKGRSYGSGSAPSGWDIEVYSGVENLMSRVYAALIDHLFIGADHVEQTRNLEEPKGLFPNSKPRSI